ncbi:MAG: LOG family protein [Parvibaculum sp.]
MSKSDEKKQGVDTPQTRSSSYTLAYEDDVFLQRDELRAVRLQIELLKPDLILEEKNIRSTIVVFGSARAPSPERAEETYAASVKAAALLHDEKERTLALRRAERVRARTRYYDEARNFARIAAENAHANAELNFVIATGGGPGIMEAANRGAAEAGALTIGYNISLPHEQAPNPFITPELCFQFHYFALRKMHFLMRAKALVIFPGGFGTLDELFETLTLIQTGKIEPMPVLLFGRDYWSRIVNFEVMVEEGVIEPCDLDIMTYVESASEAWEFIDQFYDDPGARPPLMRCSPI